MDAKRILIIDDEPSITRLLKLSFERLRNYQVQTANSGADGLMAARAFLPHLILLDIMMPHLSGAEIAAQLRTDPLLCQVPVIFLTAAVRKEELGGVSGKIGGRTFVAKPLNVAEVLAIVDKALGGSAKLDSRYTAPKPTLTRPLIAT